MFDRELINTLIDNLLMECKKKDSVLSYDQHNIREIVNYGAVNALLPFRKHIDWLNVKFPNYSLEMDGDFEEGCVYLLAYSQQSIVVIDVTENEELLTAYQKMFEYTRGCLSYIESLASTNEEEYYSSPYLVDTIASEAYQLNWEVMSKLKTYIASRFDRFVILSSQEISEIVPLNRMKICLERMIKLPLIISHDTDISNYAAVLSSRFNESDLTNELFQRLKVDTPTKIHGNLYYKLRHIGDIKRFKIIHPDSPVMFIVDMTFLVGSWTGSDIKGIIECATSKDLSSI